MNFLITLPTSHEFPSQLMSVRTVKMFKSDVRSVPLGILMKFDVDDENRCRLVCVKFLLNRCRFAAAVAKCLGGLTFWDTVYNGLRDNNLLCCNIGISLKLLIISVARTECIISSPGCCAQQQPPVGLCSAAVSYFLQIFKRFLSGHLSQHLLNRASPNFQDWWSTE